jgi:hypothetical protein
MISRQRMIRHEASDLPSLALYLISQSEPQRPPRCLRDDIAAVTVCRGFRPL